MKKQAMINLRLSNTLKGKFDEYCKKHGYSVSKRLRLLIERDIDG